MNTLQTPVRRKLPSVTYQSHTPAPRLGYLAGFDCDIPLTKPAQCRYYVGEYMEKITAQLTGLPELTTHGQWCPDFIRGNEAIEVKSIGKSRRVIIYDHRLTADERSGYIISYFLWIHSANALNAKTVAELHSMLRANLLRLVIVSASTIRQACAKAKSRKINYHTPGHKKGALPMMGWQLSIADLHSGQAEMVWVDGVSVPAYGVEGWIA